MGAAIARPVIAATGRYGIVQHFNTVIISGPSGEWKIDGKALGERCKINVSLSDGNILINATDSFLPGTDFHFDISFEITEFFGSTAKINCHSARLAIDSTISLDAWLSGMEGFPADASVSFLPTSSRRISFKGRIETLTRDWTISVADGALISGNTSPIQADVLEIGKEPDEQTFSTIVRGPAIAAARFLALIEDVEVQGLRFDPDHRFFPKLRMNDQAVGLAFRSVAIEPTCEIRLSLDPATDMSVCLLDVSLSLDLRSVDSLPIVEGLVDRTQTVLKHGRSKFHLESRQPNEIFSAVIGRGDPPRFGHEFTVTSATLAVENLIAGHATPSVPHDIWISTTSTTERLNYRALVASNDALSSVGARVRVKSEVICSGCAEPSKPSGVSYFATRLHRSEDLLDLQMEFYNFELTGKAGAEKLSPRNVSGPCLVIVILAPQHISEDAFLEGAGCDGASPGPTLTPIGAKAAQPSRLVFEYPRALGSLDLSDTAVLNFQNWLPKSSGASRHPNLIAPPQWDEPSIEAPKGIVLQQGPETYWRSKRYEVDTPDRYALFNIDLVPEQSFDPNEADLIRRPRVIPVWSDAFIECGVVPNKPKTDFWRSICRRINLSNPATSNSCEVLDPAAQNTTPADSTPLDVIQETTLRTIVRLSHDLTLCPEPPKANHVLLTQLGAWAELDGYWPKTKARAAYTDVKSWRHRLTQGRTQFDKVERRGFLYPYGHRLTLIEETNRRQHQISDTTYSVLKKKWYVVVEQPEVIVSLPRLLKGSDDQTFRMPFRSVRIVEKSTPNLDPPAIGKITEGNPCNTYFWGSLCKEQYFFNVKGTDWRGREIQFKAPLLFVNDVALSESQTAQEAVDLNTSLTTIYADVDRHREGGNFVPRLSRSFSDLGGQLVALQEGYQQGDTDFEVGRVRFLGLTQLPPPTADLEACALIVEQPTENTAFFYPVVEVAEARAPTLSRATAAGGGACWLSIVDPRRDGNAFEVVAVKHAAATSAAKTLQDTISDVNKGKYPDLQFQLPFDKNNDSTGGVSGPTPKIDAWSRLKGPLGVGQLARASLRGEAVPLDSVSTFRSGQLPSGEFFDLNAKILGVIPLSEIVAELGLDATTPSLLDFYNVGGDVEDSTGYTYDWDTTLSTWDSGILKFGPREGRQAKLIISAGVFILLEQNPKPVGFISGQISGFQVTLEVAGNGIRAEFDQIMLYAPLGGKIEFDVDISKVTFIGPLMEFIQKLKESLGFGNGFDIVLSATSVTAQLGPFELPGVGFGVFSMSQISFFAGCDIYFKGNKPILFSFRFSSFDRPFTLAVALLGGRGHFLIAIDTTGVQEITASLEFGATTEFNFGGFAHGNLYVMGGVFYSSKREMVPSTKNNNVMVSETVISVQIYVRAGGSLSCFGFITVSLDVNLGLAISKRGGNTVAYGTATLTFSVKIGFFKKSFSVTFSKELPGSKSSESSERLAGAHTFLKAAEFQLSLSPASPDTPFSSAITTRSEKTGLEASPAQITDGLIYATPCDHKSDTCGPSGIKAISKAQFRYYWYAFGENRKARY
ncbi:hypothetical protein [Sinorhizobium meliloti]|uniref:hypothetical protein n=1 Tax=Rhizobium meliloti TaxID=382 RepID=UPI0011E5B9C6|nr:hypothetical protein [Sinorhizobium meliloti]